MPGEPVERHHPNPVIYFIICSLHLAHDEIFFQGTYPGQRVLMIKDQEIFRVLIIIGQVDDMEAIGYRLQ